MGPGYGEVTIMDIEAFMENLNVHRYLYKAYTRQCNVFVIIFRGQMPVQTAFFNCVHKKQEFKNGRIPFAKYGNKYLYQNFSLFLNRGNGD